MMSELGISQRLKVRVKFNYNLKIANCISLNPAEYSRLKEDVEMHPLFKRLCGLTDNNERVIKRRRFPCTDVLNGSLELNERVLTGYSSPIVEVFLSEQKEVIPIIKKIIKKIVL